MPAGVRRWPMSDSPIRLNLFLSSEQHQLLLTRYVVVVSGAVARCNALLFRSHVICLLISLCAFLVLVARISVVLL